MFMQEIIVNPDLNLEGKAFYRQAVRAVISQGDDLLMIYSTVNGDYKFPGGGMEKDESHEQALRREVLEESGHHISQVGNKLAVLTEYRDTWEDKYDFMNMDSHYYLCHIDSVLQQDQRLDEYEANLGFTPRWISINDALSNNRNILSESKNPPLWIQRELIFLEYLSKSPGLLKADDLLLRDFKDEDYDGIRSWVNNPKITAHLPDAEVFDHEHSEQETRGFLKYAMSETAGEILKVISDSNTGEYLGQIDIYDINSEEGFCVFDFVLKSLDLYDSTICDAVIHLVVDYIFIDLGLSSIKAFLPEIRNSQLYYTKNTLVKK